MRFCCGYGKAQSPNSQDEKSAFPGSACPELAKQGYPAVRLDLLEGYPGPEGAAAVSAFEKSPSIRFQFGVGSNAGILPNMGHAESISAAEAE